MQVIGEGVAILSDSATVAMAVPRAMAASIGITPHANSTACQLAAFDEGERIAHKLTTRSTVRGSACRPDRASERMTERFRALLPEPCGTTCLSSTRS